MSLICCRLSNYVQRPSALRPLITPVQNRKNEPRGSRPDAVGNGFGAVRLSTLTALFTWSKTQSLQPRFNLDCIWLKLGRPHKRLSLLTLKGQFTRDPCLICARMRTQLEGLHHVRDWHNVREGGGDPAMVWYGVGLLWIMPPIMVNNN